jgi:hypothetical protein
LRQRLLWRLRRRRRRRRRKEKTTWKCQREAAAAAGAPSVTATRRARWCPCLPGLEARPRRAARCATRLTSCPCSSRASRWGSARWNHVDPYPITYILSNPQPIAYQVKKPVSKFAFQTQPAALHLGRKRSQRNRRACLCRRCRTRERRGAGSRNRTGDVVGGCCRGCCCGGAPATVRRCPRSRPA